MFDGLALMRILAGGWLVLAVACAPRVAPVDAHHPAHRDAPVGRLAGPPAALRPGVVDMGPPPKSEPDPHAGHGAPVDPHAGHTMPAPPAPKPAAEPAPPPEPSAQPPKKPPVKKAPVKKPPPKKPATPAPAPPPPVDHSGHGGGS
jgi:outer membrane biosynthesis protein TonB